MKTRRNFLKDTASVGAVALFSYRLAFSSEQIQRLAVPANGRIKVAFMIGDNTNMIDMAGPWEVFQDSHANTSGDMTMPFDLITIAPEDKLYRMTGGMQVKPDFTIKNAPQPNVVVVPAHRATPDSRAWLKRVSEKADVTMSVCTGAFQVARAGLLTGMTATTHHDYWDDFAGEFKDVKLERGLRFIDHGRVATAGGLTSGIDLALHIVSRYLGVDSAKATARYMEYQSEAWMT
jgi:transcriptional regulator GlxA family with amidase domain